MPCCRRYSQNSSSGAVCPCRPQAGHPERPCLQQGLLHMLADRDASSKHETCCNMLCRVVCCRCCEPASSPLLSDAACSHLRPCCLLQVKGEMEPAAEARDAQAKRKPLQPSSQVKGTSAGEGVVLSPVGTHETSIRAWKQGHADADMHFVAMFAVKYDPASFGDSLTASCSMHWMSSSGPEPAYTHGCNPWDPPQRRYPTGRTALRPNCGRPFVCQAMFSRTHLSGRGIPQACMWSTPLPHPLLFRYCKRPAPWRKGLC